MKLLKQDNVEYEMVEKKSDFMWKLRGFLDGLGATAGIVVGMFVGGSLTGGIGAGPAALVGAYLGHELTDTLLENMGTTKESGDGYVSDGKHTVVVELPARD